MINVYSCHSDCTNFINSMAAVNTFNRFESNNSSIQRVFEMIIENEFTIEVLLQGVDIDAKGPKGHTLLLQASACDRKNIVELLINSGANVNYCNDDGWTVLHYASQKGWTEIVQSLVKKVHDIDARDKDGNTALHVASGERHLEIMKYLMENGANINVKDHYGATPLLWAAADEYKDVCNLLLSNGADVDGGRSIEGLTVLHFASQNGNDWIEIVQYLVKRVPNLDVTDYEGFTALHVAADRGNLEIVKCLVEEGVNINAKTNVGIIPLWWAALNSHKDVYDFLIHAGSDTDSCNATRVNVLHLASQNGNEWLEIVLSLALKLPDLNARDDLGETALHMAASQGCLEIVRCLMHEGADVHARDYDGDTPLLCAARNGRRDVVDLLLGTMENVDTLLLISLTNGWLDLVEPLMKAVTDLNATDEVGNSALHVASVYGHTEVVKRLVEEGVDINARNKDGQTALLLACQMQKLDIVEYLLQANANCNIADIEGYSALHYLIKTERPSVKIIKLVIEKVSNLMPADYNAILSNSLLKVNILQDVQFCSQAIVNKFNNHDLHELYTLPVARSLPPIERMKIVSQSERFQSIEKIVMFDIKTNGHCNLLNVSPKVLSVLSFESVLEYHKKFVQQQVAFDKK